MAAAMAAAMAAVAMAAVSAEEVRAAEATAEAMVVVARVVATGGAAKVVEPLPNVPEKQRGFSSLQGPRVSRLGSESHQTGTDSLDLPPWKLSPAEEMVSLKVERTSLAIDRTNTTGAAAAAAAVRAPKLPALTWGRGAQVLPPIGSSHRQPLPALPVPQKPRGFSSLQPRLAPLPGIRTSKSMQDEPVLMRVSPP